MPSIEQRSLSELIQMIDWEDRLVEVQELPETVGLRPERSLLSSIGAIGVMSPVLACRSSGGSYVILDGNRRVAAARELGFQSVPCRVAVEDQSEAAQSLALLIANEQRGPNPASEVEAIRSLVESELMSERDISRLTGIPVQRVKKRLQLLNLIPYWMDQMMSGEMSVSVSENVAKLSRDEQEKLREYVQESGKKITLKLLEESREVRSEVKAQELFEQFGGMPDRPKPVSERVVEVVNRYREEVGSDDPRIAEMLDEIERVCRG
jgi:ParB/RepB/Spo0J family partition protein